MTTYATTEELRVTTKPIAGHPGYRIGRDGTVWTCRGGDGVAMRGGVEVLRWKAKTFGGGKRYRNVTLYSGSRGTAKTRSVHSLVLEAFIGPRPRGMECLHRNGNPRDNRVENLMWGTSTQNAHDRLRHGTVARGSRQGRARLTDADVVAIRRLAGTDTKTAIGKRFRVSRTAIANVLRGHTWAHIAKEGV